MRTIAWSLIVFALAAADAIAAPSDAELNESVLGILAAPLKEVEGQFERKGIPTAAAGGNVVFTEAVPYSPAAASDLKLLDVIVRIGQRQMRNVNDISVATRELPAGKPAAVSVRRAETINGRLIWQTRRIDVTPLSRRDFLISCVYPKVDEVAGTTWYTHFGQPRSVDVSDDLHLYIGRKAEGAPWLRMRIQYIGEDWLFIDRYTIRAGERSFEINAGYSDVKRDNNGRRIWEWYDMGITDESMAMIEAMAAAEEITVRHIGKDYHSDRILNVNEMLRFRTMYTVFELLKADRIKIEPRTSAPRSATADPAEPARTETTRMQRVPPRGRSPRP